MKKSGQRSDSSKRQARLISRTAVGLVGLYAVTASQGREALYLDYRYGGKRIRETVPLRLWQQPRNAEERSHNKEMIRQGEIIRAKRENDLQHSEAEVMKPRRRKDTNFFDFFSRFVDEYPNKDKRVIISAYRKLAEYNRGEYLPVRVMDEKYLQGFARYLHENLNGETPYNYLTKLAKAIKVARKQGVIEGDPMQDIKKRHPQKGKKLMKDILTAEELRKLSETPCQNETLRRAFLFACMTGLRSCDIRALRWGHINTEGYVRLDQQKTGGEIIVRLNPQAENMAGQRGDKESYVFPNLPSPAGSNKTIKAWVRRAGIGKSITWHCARHTFGVLLDAAGVNLQTIMDLMGHRDVKMTLIYRRYNKQRAEEAVNKLPELSI